MWELPRLLQYFRGCRGQEATIATGMMLGNEIDIAKFSFLMVLVPVMGANILEFKSWRFYNREHPFGVIAAGFVTALYQDILHASG